MIYDDIDGLEDMLQELANVSQNNYETTSHLVFASRRILESIHIFRFFSH